MKVLVAIDDSKFSQDALHAVAAQIPKTSPIRILHVLQPVTLSAVPQMAPQYAPELESQGREARALVEQAAATLRAAGFSSVEPIVAKGDIRLQIIDVAAEWKADLIVVGSHGRTGIPRLLLGSVAEYVARNASCSVQIVRVDSQGTV